MSELEGLQWLFDKSYFELNLDQKLALWWIIKNPNKNINLVGLAGSGKSTVMRLLKIYYEDTILFTAYSGVANLSLPDNIGNGTAHSCLSLPTKLSTDFSIKKVSMKTSNIFGSTDLIQHVVIDEAYGLNSDNLHVIEERFRRFNKRTKSRNARKLRLILVGDPVQMVTIANKDFKTILKEKYGSHLMFRSSVWGRFDFANIVLNKVERQENNVFKECLSVIRYHQEERLDKCLEWVNRRVKWNYPKNQLVLAATNKTVDKINNEVLLANPNEKVLFEGRISGDFDMKNVLVEKDITVCVGLRVMTLVNDQEQRFVNGSQGVITGLIQGIEGGVFIKFDNGTEEFVGYHLYEEKEPYTVQEKQPDGTLKNVMKEKLVGSLFTLPIRQSSSFSISKSQGLTIKQNYVIDPESDWLYTSEKLEDFGTNFMYIALTRAVNIESITLARKLKREHIKYCRESLNFWFECEETNVIEEYK